MYSLSITIPNYNGEKLIKNCILSVYSALKHSHISDYEIIISDDASTDSSIAIIEKTFPEIILIKNDKNKGFSSNINKAIFKATKDLVLLLNTDVILNDNSLQPLFKYFKEKDTFGAMGILFNPSETETLSNAVFPAMPFSFVLRLKDYRCFEKDSYYTLYLVGGFALVDREKLQFLGGFEELFNPYYAEDLELSLRAWRAGYKSYFDASSFAKHIGTATIGKEKQSKVKWSTKKNKLLVYYLHHQPIIFWSYFIVASLKAIYKLCIFKIEYIYAIKTLLLNTPKLNRLKKANKSLYKMTLRQIIKFFKSKLKDSHFYFVKSHSFYKGEIEKNIIQTWKRKKIPTYLESFSNSWRKQYNFKYLLFTDNQIKIFVKEQYAFFYDTFCSLKPIEKTDVFRLMAVYEYGGIYVDLDTSCERSLDAIFNDTKGSTFIVGTEIKTDKYFQITNWAFIAKKHHPALKNVIDKLCIHIEENPNLETLEKTGPVIFTKLVLEEIKTDDSIKILPIKYFGAGQKHSNSPPKKDGYILHHFMGSWKKRISWSKKIRFFFSKS